MSNKQLKPINITIPNHGHESKVNKAFLFRHSECRIYHITIAFVLTLLFIQTPSILAQTQRRNIYKKEPCVQPDGKRIFGRVENDKGEPTEALLYLFQNGVLNNSSSTGQSGYYNINEVPPGTYELLAVHGEKSMTLKGIVVNEWKPTRANIRFAWQPSENMVAYT